MDGDKRLLKKQIEELFGRMLYTYVTHQKQIERLNRFNCMVTWGEIGSCVFSVISLATEWLPYISLLSVVASLVIVLFSYAKEYQRKIYSHMQTVKELWLIREKIYSLLVDIDGIFIDEIVRRRDKIIEDLNIVYAHALPTDRESYEQAQKAIKNNEQGFSKDELDRLLPCVLQMEGDKKD